MFKAPECIDALEARIGTNVEYFKVERYGIPVWFVRANCLPEEGTGYTIENAVISFIAHNKLA